jgi:hypothetical protein
MIAGINGARHPCCGKLAEWVASTGWSCGMVKAAQLSGVRERLEGVGHVPYGHSVAVALHFYLPDFRLHCGKPLVPFFLQSSDPAIHLLMQGLGSMSRGRHHALKFLSESLNRP